MSKLILVTGGARSGKSDYAEQLAKESPLPVSYVATAEPHDEEMKRRIEVHRERRPIDWETIEEPLYLFHRFNSLCKKKQLILVDCVTVYLSNKLMKYWDKWDERFETFVLEEFKKMIDIIKKNEAETIFVTNEVGFGLVPEHKMGRVFRDLAGRANRIIAESSDEVYLVISGIPTQIK
ncbi:bifunctional adenosylcobinamide kinase/adenosylcobinamide-phosphate guanylyltransferase [Natranaerofaba carboxydovora]|uniref:bifunctional adenosylcobinamide kinase/adenosylcobinamide-phosphate guanylyltransferase n=1 Tax=Natranaerofaba carboxydovora TaxID=2742683 RepID=UPI001F12CE11|nr:bifunctional adenosylcobinamide kinase/adenosylcobinamide-phosphate guanylyltransferase [Natranaerofaba carboxydovora]UMZ73143.1 Bifunctional adenosylcobalamin biosynthesis protein CobU [Natranaerofaba carboxydovora]